MTADVVGSLTPYQSAERIVTNTATVAPVAGIVGDLDPTNNTASDSDVVVLAATTATTGEFFDSGQTLGDHDSWGVSLGDLDGDGDLDAFVANYGEANRVWINQGVRRAARPARSPTAARRLEITKAAPCRWAMWTATAIWTPLSPTTVSRTECGSTRAGAGRHARSVR